MEIQWGFLFFAKAVKTISYEDKSKRSDFRACIRA